jgi:hypothetical protein
MGGGVGAALLGLFFAAVAESWNLPLFLVEIVAGFLLALAPASWLALTWSLKRITDRIAFDDDGILLHVTDGKVVEVPWKDPEFSVDLVNWGRGDFSAGTILLTSKMDPGLPHGMITVDGAAALRSEALGRGLSVEAKVVGRPPKLWGTLELRPRGPESNLETPSGLVPPPGPNVAPDGPGGHRSLGQ